MLSSDQRRWFFPSSLMTSYYFKLFYIFCSDDSDERDGSASDQIQPSWELIAPHQTFILLTVSVVERDRHRHIWEVQEDVFSVLSTYRWFTVIRASSRSTAPANRSNTVMFYWYACIILNEMVLTVSYDNDDRRVFGTLNLTISFMLMTSFPQVAFLARFCLRAAFLSVLELAGIPPAFLHNVNTHSLHFQVFIFLLSSPKATRWLL